jgi:nuclear pore complex protein Nup205
MSAYGSLEGLQSLHRDLVALSESRLPNVERLWTQLQSRVEEFRVLLEKPPKNDTSRQSLSKGQKASALEENDH